LTRLFNVFRADFVATPLQCRCNGIAIPAKIRGFRKCLQINVPKICGSSKEAVKRFDMFVSDENAIHPDRAASHVDWPPTILNQ
jgi:hypothetical protein